MTGRCAHTNKQTNTLTNTHTSNERIISAIHFVHLAEIKILVLQLYCSCIALVRTALKCAHFWQKIKCVSHVRNMIVVATNDGEIKRCVT